MATSRSSTTHSLPAWHLHQAGPTPISSVPQYLPCVRSSVLTTCLSEFQLLLKVSIFPSRHSILRKGPSILCVCPKDLQQCLEHNRCSLRIYWAYAGLCLHTVAQGEHLGLSEEHLASATGTPFVPERASDQWQNLRRTKVPCLRITY